MFLRVDPSKSSGNDLYVIDKGSDYNLLKSNIQLSCLQGQYYNLPNAVLIENQQITCLETDSNIYTLIYKI